MWENETLISIFFDLLNFGVLIALLVYLFKKYGWDIIAQQVVQENDHIVSKKDTSQRLHDAGVQLSNTIAQQKEQIGLLSERTLRWQQYVAQVAQERKNERNQYRVVVREHRDKQMNTYLHSKALSTVMPRALVSARQKLVERFASQQAKEAFMQDILDRMQKGIS